MPNALLMEIGTRPEIFSSLPSALEHFDEHVRRTAVLVYGRLWTRIWLALLEPSGTMQGILAESDTARRIVRQETFDRVVTMWKRYLETAC